MQALRLGDSSSSVAHFEMCRRMLAARLSQPRALEDSSLLKLYRVVAECIIYSLATLSPFHTGVQNAAQDWQESFDCLFSKDDHMLSPFLGGLHGVYRTMFRINTLMRQSEESPRSKPCTSSMALGELWEDLNDLEHKVPASYHAVENEDDRKLYTAKQKISVLALRIHLVKVSRPWATASDILVRRYLLKALNVLKQQNVREDLNPALRWPLTILACAAETKEDFDFLDATMYEIAAVLDPGNKQKLLSASAMLRQFRQRSTNEKLPWGSTWHPRNQLDFLLEPQHLDGVVMPCAEHVVGPIPIR